jgi:type VI protein secretion system component Hcp
LISNWSHTGAGGSAEYQLDRAFVKSWSTSGDADAPTEDINIGVGELQECTISKSMDSSSPRLAQFAINGNSPGPAQIDFVEVAGGTAADADDRPTEEVAFYYNKISFNY